MAFADTSFAEIYLVEEVTWGVVPAGPPTLDTIRVTGESLGQATTVESSQELRSDRNNPALIRTNVEASGDINFELSYNSPNALLEGAAMNDYGSVVAVSETDLVCTAPDTIATTAGDFVADGVVPGMVLKTAGFATQANNDFYTVATVSTTTITTEEQTITTEGAATATLDNDGSLPNGTIKKSYVIEKKFGDLTEFVNGVGFRVGTFSLNVAPGAIVTGSAGLLGKNMTAQGTTVGDGTPNAAPTADVMSAIDDVYAIREGSYADSTLCFTNLSFTIDNGLRSQPCIGTLGPAGIGVGRVSLSGTAEAYFESRALYEKYLDFTDSSLQFRMQDAAGNAMVFTIPKIKFTDGQVVAQGLDQDVLVSMSFEAFMHPTYNTMFQIDRFAA